MPQLVKMPQPVKIPQFVKMPQPVKMSQFVKMPQLVKMAMLKIDAKVTSFIYPCYLTCTTGDGFSASFNLAACSD